MGKTCELQRLVCEIRVDLEREICKWGRSHSEARSLGVGRCLGGGGWGSVDG